MNKHSGGNELFYIDPETGKKEDSDLHDELLSIPPEIEMAIIERTRERARKLHGLSDRELEILYGKPPTGGDPQGFADGGAVEGDEAEAARNAAAQRIASSMRPPGGRREGAASGFIHGLGPAVAESIASTVSLPGRMMDQVQPERPGYLSEEDIARQDLRTMGATRWAPEMATQMIGAMGPYTMMAKNMRGAIGTVSGPQAGSVNPPKKLSAFEPINRGLEPEYRPSNKESPLTKEEWDEFFKKQEAHEAGPEWRPESSPEFRPEYNEPEFSLHPEPEMPNLTPEQLENARVMELTQPGYHGTVNTFDEFKLPEELPSPYGGMAEPELGIHFGTRRAAVERLTLKGFEEQGVPDWVKNDPEEGFRKKHLWGKDWKDKPKSYQIIPAVIGAKKPLSMPDLGMWNKWEIESELRSHHKDKFTSREIDDATNIGQFPPPSDLEGRHKYSTTVMRNLRNLIESKGYDSVRYRNNIEHPGSYSYIIWHPNRARSIYAKFDPAMWDSRNIGAGVAGLSLVPLGYRAAQEGNSGMKRGGVSKMASGGAGNANWMMRSASRNLHFQGMIKSSIPGRTDKLPMSVPAGAYVLPADIPSALGQGNSDAGGQILSKMFSAGPYGMTAPRIRSGRPFMGRMRMRAPSMRGPKGMFQEGGEVNIESEEDGDKHVPIIAAGGEYIIHPEVVKTLGGGSISHGHKVLDQFVLHTRKENIRTLRKLKPPKK